MDGRLSVGRTCILALAPALALVCDTGCRGPGSPHIAAPTQLDRLMAAYPDLRSGRFAVIADFEDPKQMEIFQLISVSPKARCVLDTRHGRPETGAGCIRFIAGSPDDTIVINNDRAANWYLKRDWRDYDLLLFTIKSPKRGLTAEVSISGGPANRQMGVHSAIPLQRGWNLIRLGLADVGERIPLDDVRDLRLSISGASKPVKLSLDDIILAGSREDLFGNSHDRTGALYVQRAGRRWNVGAGGLFELTFANGQIVRWHNLKDDPYRLRNLVQGTTLGPNLVVLGPSDGDEAALSPFGDRVVARSTILEMNSVRTVVGCEWRFVNDLDFPLDDRPFHRWRYTIYPTGQVYVSVESTAIPATSSTSELGLAVTVAAGRDGDVRTRLEPAQTAPEPWARQGPSSTSARADSLAQSASTESLSTRAVPTAAMPRFAVAYSQGGSAAVMYVPGNQSELRELIEESDAFGRHLSFTALFDRRESATQTWHCQMLLHPPADLSDEEALEHSPIMGAEPRASARANSPREKTPSGHRVRYAKTVNALARAIAYSHPPELGLELGSPVPNPEVGAGQTGFDPTSGCYVLAPDQGRVRFTLDGRQQPYFSPAFQVKCRADEEAWVYVNHLIFKNVARDASGNLIFQIPGVIRGESVVEVLFRRPMAVQ